MSLYNYKNSKAIRISQIVLGVIAIALSVAIIAYPEAGITTLIVLLSFTLLVVGFERIVAGMLPILTKSSRIGNIIAGVLTIGLGIAVISFPVFTSILLVTLLSLGLLFLGIARIIQGVSNKDISKWSRAFIISVGILSLVISLIVIAHPISGVILLTFLLAINLLIIGIESIIHGASGKRNIVATPAH
jgi:uncharacterized membrane protein HdeD (DUF308 family)